MCGMFGVARTGRLALSHTIPHPVPWYALIPDNAPLLLTCLTPPVLLYGEGVPLQTFGGWWLGVS